MSLTCNPTGKEGADIDDTCKHDDLYVSLDIMKQVLEPQKDDILRDVFTIGDPPLVRYFKKSTGELVAWFFVEEGDERLPENERFNKYRLKEKFWNLLKCGEKSLKITGEKPNINIIHLKKEEYDALLKELSSDPKTIIIRN